MSTEPLIMESMVAVPASLAARKQWAAAAEYLTDSAICKDVAAVVALSLAQRATLCSMLGVAGSADAQTSAARIVRILNGRAGAGPAPAPPGRSTPWLSLLVSLQNTQLAAAALMSHSEVLAYLRSTPFAVGVSAVGVPAAQVLEVGYYAI